MAKEDSQSPIQRLKTAIRQNSPKKLYVFYGEEMFLLRHYLNMLHKAVVEELTESFNFHRFNSETFDMRSFAEAVENLPMMAEHTMVQVDDIDLFKLPEDSRNKLIDILTDIPDYCTLVFTYETVEFKPDKRLKKLWEALSAGELIEFAKQNQRDLVSWVSRHFSAQGKQISPDLCLYLIELTDGTMTSLGSEIGKIAAYSGANVICKADIDAVTEPALDAVVFRMTEMISAGKFQDALVTLQKLLKMQQEPIAILGAVGAHLRRLSTARTLLDNGSSYSELMKLYGISDYPAKKAMEAARRFTPKFLSKAAQLVLETDYQMKTSFDTQQRLLEMLILQLAQEVSNG